MSLGREQIETFARQLILSDWSAEAQEQICALKVAVPADCEILSSYLLALGAKLVAEDTEADIVVSWLTPSTASGTTALSCEKQDGVLRVELSNSSGLSKQFTADADEFFADQLAQAAAAGMIADYLARNKP